MENKVDIYQFTHFRKEENGFWRATKDSVSSGSRNNSEMIRQYQLQCFELSKQTLLSRDDIPSSVGTFTFCVSDEAYREIYEEMQAFKSKVRNIINQDKKDATGVHQLNLHLFTNLKK